MGFDPKCRHDGAGSVQRLIQRANSLVKGWIKRRISVQTDKHVPERALANPKSKRKSKILETKLREVKDGNTQEMVNKINQGKRTKRGSVKQDRHRVKASK